MRTKAASFATFETPGEPNVYLDYHATTPCDPLVVEAMMPFLLHEFGNPASTHALGRRAEFALERARDQVSRALGCESDEIIFTSGATESNNLAILGFLDHGPVADRMRIVTSPIEHKSVLGPIERLRRRGFQVVTCPVQTDGRVDLGLLAEFVDSRTALVSFQAASNEIGTIQPVREIAQIAHHVGAVVHCDAAQAFGKTSISVTNLGVDLLSLSGHKCYGPKGIGALYARGGAKNSRLSPIVFGGQQEWGLRPGTINVPAAIGFGRAAELLCDRVNGEADTVSSIRDRFERNLLRQIGDASVNGALDSRLPGSTSITIPGIDAAALICQANGFSLSLASACNSGSPEPSHVLLAIGLTREQAYCTIRVSFGRYSSSTDADLAAHAIASIAARLREVGSAAQ